MKGYVTASSVDERTKQCSVTKHTKYGTFSSTVQCAKEDEFSEWDGYRFAEYQCDLKALREKIKMLNQRITGIEQAYNLLLETDPTGEQIKLITDFAKSIKGQIYEDKKTLKRMESKYLEFVEKVQKDRKDFVEKHLSKNEE